MASLCVFSVVGLLQFGLVIISLKQIMDLYHKSSYPKRLCISQWIFYITSLLFAICRILTSIFYCFINEYTIYPFDGIYLFICIHLFAFLVILYLRLRLVFDQSVHKLQRVTTYFIWFILTFLITAAIGLLVGMILFHISAPSKPYFACGAAIAFVFVITAQWLSWMFMCKMHKMRKMRTPLSGKIDSDIDQRYINTIRKYGILSIISVMLTTTYIVMAVILVFSSASYEMNKFVAIILSLEVFIDSICMTLSLKVNERYFKYFCYWCLRDTLNEPHLELSDSLLDTTATIN